jgi:hypothetical protein
MRALAVAAVTGLALAGCGGGDDNNDARDRVVRFVRQANDVQQSQAPAFNRANRAYLSFSKGKLPPAKAGRELAAAEQSMRETRDRLAALEAPADARELQRRLVALFDADAALAHESTLLAGFVPASARAARPLPSIGTDLTRSLRRAAGPKGQERALRRYSTGVQSVIKALQKLHPPPLLVERHHTQVEHLRLVRRLALGLAGALRAQDGKRVAKLLLRFRKVNSKGTSSTLSREAVRGYNRRYLAIRRKVQLVEVERKRLDKEFQ